MTASGEDLLVEGARGVTRRGFLAQSGGLFLGGPSAARLLLSHGAAVRRSRLLRPAAAGVPLASQHEALRVLGRTRMRLPDSLPNPAMPAGTDTMPEIEHVVVAMMENHSYDNLLGMLGRAPGLRPRGDGFAIGADGLPSATNPYGDGRLQRAFRMPTTCQLPGKPSQEWAASHIQYANGRNDGFVISPSGPVAMGYWEQRDLPFTYSLASQFPIADRYFCSLLGQTDPNRRYLIAATSSGMTDDIPSPTQDATLFVTPQNGTIFSRLSDAGISWYEYDVQYPSLTSMTMELYPSVDEPYEPSHAKPIGDFFSAAAAGTLPAFSLLGPNFSTESQENPQNMVVGEAWLESIVRAIGASPKWRQTILIVNYDEHGGYYDHVPPPAALAPDAIPPVVEPGQSSYDGFRRYGFRVPCVVIGPYAKRRYVSHVVFDHTSVLAFLERKWNLPAMTYRDANANDLTDLLDLQAMAAGRPTFPELPPLAHSGESARTLRCSTAGAGTIPPAPPPPIKPAVRLGGAHLDRRRNALIAELYTDGPRLRHLTVELVHRRRAVLRRLVPELSEVPRAIVLRAGRHAPPPGRYRLIVHHGGETLLRRVLRVR